MESLETVEHLKEVMGNDMVEASVDGMSILAFFVYSVLSPSNFLCCVLEYFFFSSDLVSRQELHTQDI